MLRASCESLPSFRPAFRERFQRTAITIRERFRTSDSRSSRARESRAIQGVTVNAVVAVAGTVPSAPVTTASSVKVPEPHSGWCCSPAP